MVFLADGIGIRTRDEPEGSLCRNQQTVELEPLTLFSAIATHTTNIGFVATASTTYNEPYHIARKFASLDHISGGRAGWNLVTSGMSAEALNFNRDAHYGHAERYERANEFAEIVTALWDSWDDDAFTRDKASGNFFDPAKLHVLNHKGKHFSVRGPLNVPRSPQGRPVMVQAGTSDVGQDLAAEVADVLFATTQTIKAGQTLRKSLHDRLARHGREPNEIKLMPGLVPIIGASQQEADDKFNKLQSLVHPEVGLHLLGEMLGSVDLSGHPIDGPLPEITTTIGSHTALKLFTEMAKRENLTIRQLYLRAVLRGHHIEEWFAAGAADGFNVMPPYLPGALDEFVDAVVPELQRRGLFRTAYQGRTLRDNLGLKRPESRYAGECG
jgi:alkanesulfonate monooxygenase